MRITRLTQPDERSAFQKRFEYIIMAVMLCIIACRCTYTETLTSSGMSILEDYVSVFQSLTFSMLTIFIVLVWFIVSFVRRELSFRISGLISGLVIFTIAAAIATFCSADRRASFNSYFTIAGCVISGIFFVQMLKRISTIRFTAIIITALGIVNCYESFNQLSSSNEYMIEQYQSDPNSQLEAMGIEPDTLEAFLYEHRLYSKDIKGYFTTGNSLGSFLILTAFTTIGLIASRIRKFIKDRQNPVDAAILCLIFAVQFICFTAATSKGAAAAGFAGVAMLLCWAFFKKIIIQNRNTLFSTAVIGSGAVIVGVIGLAASKAYLPGGNSMLVRAEYWFASARMIRDNFFTGVGGGNFGYHYTLYKLPAAIETVLDPHNMLLSIASQYGIFGLIGFGLILFLPLTKVIVSKYGIEYKDGSHRQDTTVSNKKFKYMMAFMITLTMFIIRPLLNPVAGSDDAGVMFYIMIVMYIAPAAIFMFVVWLLDKALGDDIDVEMLQVSMFCGIVAVMLHNLVDFAIFEPGIMSMFFLVTACFVSLSKDRLNRFGWLIQIDKADAVVLSGGLLAVFSLVLWLGYAPVARATYKLDQAFSTRTLDLREVVKAAQSDRFDSKLYTFVARVLWSEYDPKQSPENLMLAEKYFSSAINVNRADFKNYKNLGKVRWEMADNTQTYKRKTLLIGAEDSYRKAILKYPGNAALHLELGKILFLQDRPDDAKREFAAALKIEEMFQKKFAAMYPTAKPVSRIGKENLEFLKGVVEE